ncbi:MAG: hypothetical protein JJ902_22400 [Roseibium sp.]|nr:hypothetical protein [Roseibium sp.]
MFKTRPGARQIARFVLGFEVQVKTAGAILPDHFAGGRMIHASGTIGVLGAVVAASRLIGLSEVHMVTFLPWRQPWRPALV